ncbi:hypothetical protein QJQ45_028367, partial [Haematococcus lacustris]
ILCNFYSQVFLIAPFGIPSNWPANVTTSCLVTSDSSAYIQLRLTTAAWTTFNQLYSSQAGITPLAAAILKSCSDMPAAQLRARSVLPDLRRVPASTLLPCLQIYMTSSCGSSAVRRIQRFECVNNAGIPPASQIFVPPIPPPLPPTPVMPPLDLPGYRALWPTTLGAVLVFDTPRTLAGALSVCRVGEQRLVNPGERPGQAAG